MTLIRELIDIPTQVRDGDFVLKLTEGVGAGAAEATVRSYEVTSQLARAFDEALGKIAGKRFLRLGDPTSVVLTQSEAVTTAPAGAGPTP